jgi:lipid-A-disaccharide synthase
MARLLVSCGEPSGDLYGAELVRALPGGSKEVEVFGLGGDRLAASGAHLLGHVRELGVVGLVEVVAHLRRLRRIFDAVLAEVDRSPPKAAVLVDYPDFNLRLARELARRRVPAIYYVSPQVWAWRAGRVRTIARTVSRMLVIFPFEREIYERAGVPVTFVGHPLVDLVRKDPDRDGFLRASGLDPARPVVTIAPGSRAREVAHNLPGLVGAARELRARRGDVQFLLAWAPGLPLETFQHELHGLPLATVRGETHRALSAATLALVASGTITVEAALLGTPMVVVYRLSPLTYALGRPLVRVPHYAMVNLIAGRRIVPEFIQGRFRPDLVAQEAMGLLASDAARGKMRDDLAEVRRLLGGPGASARAAEVVGAVLAGGDPGAS